jgi:hypothetical protein
MFGLNGIECERNDPEFPPESVMTESMAVYALNTPWQIRLPSIGPARLSYYLISKHIPVGDMLEVGFSSTRESIRIVQPNYLSLGNYFLKGGPRG